jgi:hypothetical protein
LIKDSVGVWERKSSDDRRATSRRHVLHHTSCYALT